MKKCSTREEKLHVFQIPKRLFGSKKAITGGIQLHCLHRGTITIQGEAEKQGEVQTSVTSFLYIISGKNNFACMNLSIAWKEEKRQGHTRAKCMSRVQSQLLLRELFGEDESWGSCSAAPMSLWSKQLLFALTCMPKASPA